MRPEDQRRLIHTAAKSVEYVIANWLGLEHSARGGMFHAYLFDTFKSEADYRDLYECAWKWVGGMSNGTRCRLYKLCAPEKAMRLANSYEAGHVSSFQSKVPGKTYAGAIRFKAVIPELDLDGQAVDVIFTFSGLPEEADEAAMVLLAHRMREHGWEIKTAELNNILAVSKNSVFKLAA